MLNAGLGGAGGGGGGGGGGSGVVGPGIVPELELSNYPGTAALRAQQQQQEQMMLMQHARDRQQQREQQREQQRRSSSSSSSSLLLGGGGGGGGGGRQQHSLHLEKADPLPVQTSKGLPLQHTRHTDYQDKATTLSVCIHPWRITLKGDVLIHHSI